MSDTALEKAVREARAHARSSGSPKYVDEARVYEAELRQRYSEDFLMRANPLKLDDYVDYCEVIARKYAAAPKIDKKEVWRWKLLMKHIEKMFKRIDRKLDIRFVEGQPYQGVREMREKVGKSGVLYISTDFNEHPIFTPTENLKLRAVHDYLVHIAPGKGGPDFSRRGEIRAYNLHRRLAPKDAAPALFSEVLAQACYANARGEFPDQKIAVLPGVDYYDLGVVDSHDISAKRMKVKGAKDRELFTRGKITKHGISATTAPNPIQGVTGPIFGKAESKAALARWNKAYNRQAKFLKRKVPGGYQGFNDFEGAVCHVMCDRLVGGDGLDPSVLIVCDGKPDVLPLYEYLAEIQALAVEDRWLER